MVPHSVISLFGLALAVMFWPGQAGAAEPSRWCFLGVAVPLLMFLVKVRITTLHKLVFALWCWAVLSLAWVTVLPDAFQALFQLTVLMCCVMLGSEIDDPRYLYIGLGTGMAVNSGFAVLQWMGYEPTILQFPGSAPGGLFVNPSLMGEASVLMLAVLLSARMWLLSALTFPSLLASQNRTGFAALIIIVMLMIYRYSKWWALVAACAVVPLVAFALKNYSAHTEEHFFDSIFQRADMWRDTLAGVTFFGHGIGQFYADFPMHNAYMGAETAPRWTLTAHAHNDFMEYLFELGVPGAALLAAIGGWLAVKARGAPAYGLLAIALTGLIGFPLREPFTASVAAMLAGIAAGSGLLVRGTGLRGRPEVHIRRQQPSAIELAGRSAYLSAGSLLPSGTGAAGDQG